jgi:hypothetical protein
MHRLLRANVKSAAAAIRKPSPILTAVLCRRTSPTLERFNLRGWEQHTRLGARTTYLNRERSGIILPGGFAAHFHYGPEGLTLAAGYFVNMCRSIRRKVSKNADGHGYCELLIWFPRQEPLHARTSTV